jgi:sigma-B regulation protein RsbU (phosphoserine phosphatase)
MSATDAETFVRGAPEGTEPVRRHTSCGRGVLGIHDELRLAGEVQRALLPESMPHVPGLSIEVLFRPADYVSGDIYSAARLDETHTGLALADVTGHGLAAALMTFFIRRGLCGKEIVDREYRLCSPDEVLARLNAELLETNVEHCPHATAIYATYEENTHRVSWARGGLPFPILVRQGQRPTQIRSQGSLLGAFDEAEFEVRLVALNPGDSLIFHTDGLEALLLYEQGRRLYDDISEAPWFSALGDRPLTESLAEIDRRLDETDPDAWPIDDVSLLVLTRKF